MPLRPAARFSLYALILFALGAALWIAVGPKADGARGGPLPPLGLFTTLPIYWNEAHDLAAMLSQDEERHWARAHIERRRQLRPLDVLSPEALAPFNDLLIAQPRVLSPAENVALDDWVNGGGRLLLLADPLLTEDSHFAIGDRRRPMDVALLSPILTHWGVTLQFDDAQPAGEMVRETMGFSIPVNLPGRFATHGQPNCELWSEGLLLTCALGKGRLVALADAAVLEGEARGKAREDALTALLDTAFAAN